MHDDSRKVKNITIDSRFSGDQPDDEPYRGNGEASNKQRLNPSADSRPELTSKVIHRGWFPEERQEDGSASPARSIPNPYVNTPYSWFWDLISPIRSSVIAESTPSENEVFLSRSLENTSKEDSSNSKRRISEDEDDKRHNKSPRHR